MNIPQKKYLKNRYEPIVAAMAEVAVLKRTLKYKPFPIKNSTEPMILAAAIIRLINICSTGNICELTQK